MTKTSLIFLALALMLLPMALADDFSLSDSSKISLSDSKNLQIDTANGAFSITSSVDRHEIDDISKTREWAYENAGYEIITSDKKLEVVDDNYVCLEGTKEIIIKQVGDIKVGYHSNPHCIYYPPQTISNNEDEFTALRTIGMINDNVVRVDFGDNYDPTYTSYEGNSNDTWLVWTSYYNVTIKDGILIRFYGLSTDKPSWEWTKSPSEGGNGFGSIYASGWKMDYGITATSCDIYDDYGGWDASVRFVCSNNNATNEWTFYSTYINLKSSAIAPHRHYFYMDGKNETSFALNEEGFLSPPGSWQDSNSYYGVAAYGFNQSHPQMQSSWNTSYFMAFSWNTRDFANGSAYVTTDFDYTAGVDQPWGGIAMARNSEISENRTISINIKLIKRDSNQMTVDDQYKVSLMKFHDYPWYDDPEPTLNSAWQYDQLYRRNFTIENAASETLYGYPHPIRFSIGPEMENNLSDVLFTDQSGGMLYAELESYNSTEGRAWVRIDVLPQDGTLIYMYWGKPEGESVGNSWYPYVWDDHFVGVWHLNNLSAEDSSMYHNDGIIMGAPSVATGVIGTGMSVDSGDGGDGINVANFTALYEWITAELFLKPETADGSNFQRIMCKGPAYDNCEWCVYQRYNQSDGAIDFRINNGSSIERTHALNKDGAWHYEGITFDRRDNNDGGNDVRIMFDGIEETDLALSWPSIAPTSYQLGLGNENDQGSDVESDFDEFRVSNIARSVGWRNQTYNSILKYETIVTEGSTEYLNGSETEADEEEGRAAIETGIANSELTNPTIETDVVVYVVLQNGSQSIGTYDKFASDSNKRWAFNYITGSDSFQNLNSLQTIMNFWENESLTSAQISSFVSGFINSTN